MLKCTDRNKWTVFRICHYRNYLTFTLKFPSTKWGASWKICSTYYRFGVPDRADSNLCQKGPNSHCTIFLKTIHTPAYALTSVVTSYILLSAGQYICLLNSPSTWEVNLFSRFWFYWSYFMFGLHVGGIWCACFLTSLGKGSGSFFSFK